MFMSRRNFLSVSSGLPALGVFASSARAWGQVPPSAYAIKGADAFPQQDPALVKDAISASHGNFARIRELVEHQPAMAGASIDWGFGDWETCLDAASHVGNKPIADFLLAHGARPTIFSAAMMGQLDVVKALIAARPGIQRTRGPHGITLLAHAKAGGADAMAVVEYLTAVGDADLAMPVQPLAAADRDMLVGKYVYGAGPRDFFTIDVQQDRLGIDRPGSPARRFLMHVGNLVFFPIGVPHAKIAFAREDGKVTHFTIADPDLLLTARRT
ncbi:MAG TPA: hypothetical protein VEC39_10075 [Vicinamibacterales bacterium]|nr:hypothetical protein [Vicinamibacterales bacterium]